MRFRVYYSCSTLDLLLLLHIEKNYFLTVKSNVNYYAVIIMYRLLLMREGCTAYAPRARAVLAVQHERMMS